MSTFTAFGMDFPLAVLLALGISLLIAAAFLAIVAALSSGRAEGGEVRPREQLGDDTLAMVAEDPAAKAADRFTRVGWVESPPGSGYWVKASDDTTPGQRRAARQAYDRRDLLADDECPLEDIALDADALVFMAEVLADIDDQPTYIEGAQ